MTVDVQDVVIEVVDETAVVRLNRPDRGNSVTPAVVTRLGEAVQEVAELGTVRAIVLTGTGKVFCAGADVREMYAVYTADGAQALMDYLADVWMPAVQRTVRAIWTAPRPVVAAYNGAATAGGLDFGLACDVRIAASTARFAESYVNLGMVPVAGGAFLLPEIIGLSAATELLASGELIDAARAGELGLVGYVCEVDELADRALEIAARMARGPIDTFARVKRIARTSALPGFDAALQASYDANVDLISQEEVRSKILAVMERYSLGRG